MLERRISCLHRSESSLYFRSLRNEHWKIVPLFYTLHSPNALIDHSRGFGWLVRCAIELG